MNITLFGSHGRVGEKVRESLTARGHEVSPVSRCNLDLSSLPAVENYLSSLEESPPDALINCAAISGLEACLDDPVTAHCVNAMAPEAMARFSERTAVRFIHLSTDYVLDGRRPGKKDESAKCKPANTYGESKWEAELRIKEAHPLAIIARVSWVYGNARHPSFPDMIAAKALKGEPLAAIHDKWSLPTHIDTITSAMESFLHHPQTSGIYHVCDSGEPVTWHDYATEILSWLRSKVPTLPAQTITPQKMGEISFFRDPRPVHTAMDNKKLVTLLQHPIPDWKDNLSSYVNALTLPAVH